MEKCGKFWSQKIGFCPVPLHALIPKKTQEEEKKKKKDKGAKKPNNCLVDQSKIQFFIKHAYREVGKRQLLFSSVGNREKTNRGFDAKPKENKTRAPLLGLKKEMERKTNMDMTQASQFECKP